MSDLRLVPGIGAKKEKELMDLGYGSLEELKNADPDELYFLACAKAGSLINAFYMPSVVPWRLQKTPLPIRMSTAGGISVMIKRMKGNKHNEKRLRFGTGCISHAGTDGSSLR